MQIDVWSDVVCPWCFIGRRRLQKAIAKIGVPVTVRHRAFQLQPDLNETVPTKELLASKYRISEIEVQSMQANVCSIADGEGLCYDLSETQSGNTRDAHRLLLWAETIGKQDPLLEAMYSAYFEKKQSLFTHDDLLSLINACGIDQNEAREILNSERFQAEFDADIALARELGITGVPFYAVDMRYGISGAQPDEVFFETLKEAIAHTDI
jgi:predicted DsbA family dithiol-disulfide isomerase